MSFLLLTLWHPIIKASSTFVQSQREIHYVRKLPLWSTAEKGQELLWQPKWNEKAEIIILGRRREDILSLKKLLAKKSPGLLVKRTSGQAFMGRDRIRKKGDSCRFWKWQQLSRKKWFFYLLVILVCERFFQPLLGWNYCTEKAFVVLPLSFRAKKAGLCRRPQKAGKLYLFSRSSKLDSYLVLRFGPFSLGLF